METSGNVTKAVMQRGSCSGCGECCTHVVFAVPTLGEDDKKYYEYHKVEMFDNGGKTYLKITCPCGHYDKKTKKCKIYDERPNACRRFPWNEESLIKEFLPNCTYYFD